MIPVKLKQDGFNYLGEAFAKGDIFDAPHEALASYMCDQEKMATRVDEKKLEPAKVGTMKREMRGEYDTKVMSPGDNDGKPKKTKGGSKGKGKVKAASNESNKDT